MDRTEHGVLLTEEHYFWTDHPENVRDFAPTFVVNKLHRHLVVVVLLETAIKQVVTGVLVNRLLHFLFVNLLHLLQDILLQAHVGPVRKHIFHVSLVFPKEFWIQV